MDETSPEPQQKRVWLLGTPLLPPAMALLIILVWIPTISMTDADWIPLHYDFAVVPSRFFAPDGSEFAYPSIFHKLFSLVTVSLLHADLIHVGLNALMMWQFGAPVARVLGPGITGAGKWMLLYIVSVFVGSLFFLLIAGNGAPMVVGASGGTSGLIAATFLIDRDGRIQSPLTRSFAINSAIFALINAVMVWGGPYLGFLVSWEAHLGGYVAGVAMMLILGRKIRALPA